MNQTALEDATEKCLPSFRSTITCAWPALLLTTVCLLPFLHKAFLVDDAHFLAMARQVLRHPAHPMDFQVCWNMTENCTKAYVITPGNALMGYVLVPTILAGNSEWMAHATQLAFAFIALIGMSSLVLRFGWSWQYAMAGALLLAALPPFMPMASTAMPDVLACAVGLVAIERLLAWKVQRKWHQGASAAIALGLSGFARSHLALLVPLGAFLLFDTVDPRRMLAEIRKNAILWSPVISGGILLAAIILLTRERSMGLDPPPAFRGFAHIPKNLISYLFYLAFPLPLTACWVLYRWNTRRRRLIFPLIVATIICFFGHHRVVFFCAVLTIAALTDLFFGAVRGLEHRKLFLLLWVLVPLPIVYYGHLPIKYLLPCVPAVILICFCLSAAFPARLARTGCIVLIGGSTAYSLLILHSDAEFANFGRTAMNELIKPEIAAGRKVWYTGNFNAYWYAQEAGASLFVPGGAQPNPGDRLAVGVYEELGRPNSLRRFSHRTLLRSVSHTYSFGRTMGEGIGFYSNTLGYWLWGFGPAEWDRYELWRIDKFVP
jgi:hypothetical protein